VVEEQKRVEVIEPARPDASAQMNAGAFDDRFGRHDVRYWAR
jgi:hypothetical protein